MDLHHLKTLRELRDRESVTAVAAALGITPSAVSQHLAVLQRKSPVPLTVLNGRRLALTAAGARLADSAAEALAAFGKVEQHLANLIDDDTAPVSVAGFNSACLMFFPHLLRRADSVRYAFTDEDVPVAVFPRLTSQYDLVIAHRPAHSPPWKFTGLVSIPLIVEPLDIACRTGHPLVRNPGEHRLDEFAWLTVHDHLPLASAAHLIGTVQNAALNTVHRVNDFHIAAAIIAATDTVTVLPRYLGVPSEHKDRIALLPAPGQSLNRHIELLCRRETLSRPAVRRTVHALQELSEEISRTPQGPY
jgi:DNA-binding transcriptional LysR family regulator